MDYEKQHRTGLAKDWDEVDSKTQQDEGLIKLIGLSLSTYQRNISASEH